MRRRRPLGPAQPLPAASIAPCQPSRSGRCGHLWARRSATNLHSDSAPGLSPRLSSMRSLRHGCATPQRTLFIDGTGTFTLSDSQPCRLLTLLHGHYPSGRRMARTGLRMMPTFPSSSLKFRTVGFPQYGFKAGLSDEAFPSDLPVKPAPGIPFASHGLPSPFALSVVVTVSPLNVGPVTRWNAAIQGNFLPLPQRSSLRSGL